MIFNEKYVFVLLLISGRKYLEFPKSNRVVSVNINKVTFGKYLRMGTGCQENQSVMVGTFCPTSLTSREGKGDGA